MRPGCIIPPPADHISAMLQCPAEILTAMEPVAARMREVFATEEMVKAKTKRTAEAVLGNGDAEGGQPEAKKSREDLEMGVSVAEVTSLHTIFKTTMEDVDISSFEARFFRLEASTLWMTSGRLLAGAKLWRGLPFSWRGWS